MAAGFAEAFFAAVSPASRLPVAALLPWAPGPPAVRAALSAPGPVPLGPSRLVGLAVRLGPAVWVLFLPFTSLAATPPEAAASVVLPDADCCTADFFATMAAAPSHIVISRANRAGTINRLLARGNGARQRCARHARAARQACIRCAQLSAR